jgi:type IX secretion system PorP/SprF family membrane protein
MKKYFYALFFLLLLIEGVGSGLLFAQQDAQYNQYMFNQLSLNPAVAGSREVFATSLLYRRQWVGIEGAPSTASLTMQMPMKRKNIGVGIEVVSDKLGPKNVSSLLASYAYRLKLSKGKLAFGLRLGMYNYVYDLKHEYFKDQNDAYIAWERSSKFTPTSDFGFYYHTRTFYAGLSATHLNRGKMFENNSDSARQAIHVFIPVSKAFMAGKTVINPVLLIKSAVNAPPQTDLGCNIQIQERLWLGFLFRSHYGTTLLAQYQINDKMKIGYSFDKGINRIGRAGGVSHEIMLGYDINILGSKLLTPRYL